MSQIKIYHLLFCIKFMKYAFSVSTRVLHMRLLKNLLWIFCFVVICLYKPSKLWKGVISHGNQRHFSKKIFLSGIASLFKITLNKDIGVKVWHHVRYLMQQQWHKGNVC